METFSAVFDGRVFVPDGPVDLEPNVRVRVVLDTSPRIGKEERKAVLERLLENPGHGGGFDWAEWERGDVYP